MAPGNGARSNPARVWPHRTHVTSGAGVLNLRETEQLECADVGPADVELVPLGLELGRARIVVVVVVQLFATKPDRDGRDVAALVLHVKVAIAKRMADAVDDASGPERDPHHLDRPNGRAEEEPK